MNNERAKTIDIVFNRGLRQDLNPQTSPPGVLVDCDNLEFDQLGRLVRRDGFVSIGISQALANGVIPQKQIRRLAQTPDGARLTFGDDGAFLYFPASDKVAQANLFGFYYRQHATMTGAQGICADNNGGLLFVDSIAVGTWIVYLYILRVSYGGSGYNVYADVVDAVSGARPLARVALDFGSTTPGNFPTRLVRSGGSSTVFALWENAAGTGVRYAKIDLAGSTLFWTAAADLVTNSGPCVFDADTMQSGWVFAYLNAASTLVTINTYDVSAAVTNTNAWKANAGANTWAPTALAITGNGFNPSSLVHVVGYDPATFFVEANTLSSALVHSAYARVNPGLDHAKHAKHFAISHFATTQSVLAFTNYASNTVSTNPRGHLIVYTLTDSGTLTSITTLGNYCLASRFYMDSSARGQSLMMVARFDDPSGAQNHFLLAEFGFNPGVETYPISAQVQLHFCSGRVPLKSENAVYGLGGIADLSSVQPGLFQFCAVANIGASQFSGNQVQAWTFQCLDSKRYLTTECQGELVIGGGTPQVFDGQKFTELSFYSYPVLQLGNVTTSNAGGSIAQGVYQYRAVYEWTDAKGNRQQSPASPAITVDMSGAGFAGGTNSVAFSLASYEATRKQGGPGVNDQVQAIQVVFYRTLAGQSTFYRVPGGGGNHGLITTFTTFTDTFADASISGNEPIYTRNGGQGLLDSTAPPPTLALTTHAGRLWGVDCENPERIWCTRVLQQYSAPAYNPALQILIPGAGRINGLGGQDGKLYALATNGIYLASYGDGPDDTGGGSFPSPQLITTTANCQDPRGVLVGQEGIFFTGTDQWGTGIYLIRRGDGQPISIGKRVRRQLAATPICRGVVNRTGKARTEFLFVDSDTNPTTAALLYYHHDYLDEDGIGQWTTGRIYDGVRNEPIECLGTWDDVSVVADASRVGLQTVGTVGDLGLSTPLIAIETADLRPFGLTGYGQLSGVTLLGTASTTDNIQLQASYDSGSTYPDVNLYAASTETAGKPVLRRWDMPTSKLPEGGTVRIRVTDQFNPSAPGTTYFHGLSLQVVPLGGDARLDNARRA